MIEALMTAFASAIASAFARPSAAAYAAAALWGALSVFLSPCHLGSIPLIVAYANNGTNPSRKKAFAYSALFALGLLAMLAAVGVATSAAGRLFGDVGDAPRIVVAVFIVLCGLWLADVPPLSKLSFSFEVRSERRGLLGAFLLGLVYGVALGPCSFAFLAPMLAFVFRAGGSGIAFGATLMVLYALGHTAAIVAAGTFGDVVRAALSRRGSGEAATWFKRALGAAVVLAGAAQLVQLARLR